jgi:superfamily II DNA helicase RecQ
MLHQLTQESMDAMLAVSERWHVFWQMPSRSGEAVKQFSSLCYSGGSTNTSHLLEAIKRKQDSMEEDLRSIRRKLEQPPHPTAPPAITAAVAAGITRSAALLAPVSAALVKVTGSHCTKTLEQAYALNAIHAKETPLTIVMATGSGKSVLFMAPLHWLPPASVVVVVVPFIALTEDLLEQCHRNGILASKWTGYHCASKVEGSQLVFVAAEHCYSQSFALWAQELEQQKRLAALFFDECHVCLMQKDFRPAMDKIKALTAAVHVPQYYLTATLPPALVPAFKMALHLPQDGMGMIRAATNRKNISYAVQQVASTSELLFRIKRALVHHSAGAVMVFCKTKSYKGIPG